MYMDACRASLSLFWSGILLWCLVSCVVLVSYTNKYVSMYMYACKNLELAGMGTYVPKYVPCMDSRTRCDQDSCLSCSYCSVWTIIRHNVDIYMYT